MTDAIRDNAHATAAPQRQSGRAAFGAFVGTAIEWYDFFIYATASALVFGHVFFPNTSDFIGTLASFATFAIGFFARPLGGIIFGHLGDKLGRKKSLVITLLMMGICTLLIGLLPGYNEWGYFAPIALVLLRIVQGIAVGGEWGGAVLIAGEHAPKGWRTFFSSFAQMGSPAGAIMAVLAFRYVSGMEETAFLDWGWRIPFLASAVLLVIGYCIRVGVSESPEFQEMQQRQAQRREHSAPIAQLFRHAKLPLVAAILANAITVASFYFTNTFMIAYATQYLSLSRVQILDGLFVTAIVQLLWNPVAALIAQAVGTMRFLVLIGIGAMAAPFIMFTLVGTGEAALIATGLSMNALFAGGFYAVIAGYMSEAFPADYRYSGISLAYQVAGAVFGGATPFLGTILAAQFVGQWWPMALFYASLAALSVVGVLMLNHLARTRR
ncbi:LysR family transcriptional regulator [Lampropedia cohaerens]|uniref:LysR family transcriptional regulator n=1 Tax=Lampropedia cohaerens TaxID=1610491 RepID=A0A0U1PWQ0_9BURK|nr:MFS transporter [Lampropedia cohaerens]KKW66867.1 LysR family transcriptional regulator [Lampropedia cohaerens]